MQRDRLIALDSSVLTPHGSGTARVALTDWQMVCTSPSSVAAPGQLVVPAAQWTAAQVPGTVASALREAGKWDRATASSLDDQDWWYRCAFVCARPELGASIDFQGLATLADVWLNGEHILSSDNMFVGHVVDAGRALRETNELVMRFASLTEALGRKRPRPRWKTRLVMTQNLRWFRTSLLGRMPGLSASAQPVGPWKPVVITQRDVPRIASRSLVSRMDGHDGIVAVSARIELPVGAILKRGTVRVGEVERAAVVRIDNGVAVINATIRLPEARTWWPHTHGAQPLYEASLAVAFGDEMVTLSLGRVGFRTVKLDDERGDFGLRVNGEKIFWRGVCWSPADPVAVLGAPDNYRRTLELLRAGGMNMIRVGGTMAYESDDFYDLCDELGIVVWQDLMFANMDYPASDPAFLANVELEVRQLLSRIGNRPSLGLICGNSEAEQQAAMLGLPRSEWRGDLFARTIPDLCRAFDAGIPYWPSSPSGGVFPFHVNAGDGHYFGYGPYLRPVSDVRSSNVRFASETLALSNIPEPDFIDRLPFGSAGAGHHPDWKRGVPRDNGASWDFEDVRDHYVGEIFGVDPAVQRRQDPDRYLALGRAACGEIVTNTVAEWRRSESTCNGALVWLCRDLVPGAGHGILDVDGAPKSAYYYLARAFKPVTVTITDEGLNGASIHVVNDGADDASYELKVGLFSGSVRVREAATIISVAPRSTISISADDFLGSFTDVSYAYRFGPSNHDAMVATLLDGVSSSHLAQAFHFPVGLRSVRPAGALRVEAERAGPRQVSLCISADAMAIAVAIEAPGWRISDNHFHLAPESEREILLTSAAEGPSLTGRVSALNCITARSFSVE